MPKEPGTKTERDEIVHTEVAPTERERTTAPDTVAEAPAVGVIGRFRLEGTLGSGGMADVYRAHDPMLDRNVALKVLRTKRSADAPQRMRRVLREARAAAALTHPNTVTIFDVGEADGEVFIAMELLEGQVLRASLGRGEISLDQKLRWLLQAARALGAAHERGLVHRDVKPDNMFVCTDGTLKLLDFGIAKRDEDDSLSGPPDSTGPSSMRTAEGRRLGTPRYMAPEQHAGLPTDARTDEYAWGLVAFELLTGASPVAGTARLADLRAKVPELPDAIATTISRALELHKEDRFPSMAPIIEALERRAEVVPPRRRSARWLSAGVIAVVVTGGAAGLWVLARSRAPGRGVTAATTARSPIAMEPACRVESTRTMRLAMDDRFGVLPDGTIVAARDIRRGIALERETASGRVPFTKSTMLKAMGTNFADVALHGTTYQGGPAVVLEFAQGNALGSLLMLVTEGQIGSSHRVRFASGLAVAPFGNSLVVVTTTPEQTGGAGRAGEADAQILAVGMQRNTVEVGNASLPAVATTRDRIAFAYYARSELHLAILDENAERIGDAMAIAPTALRAPPAVAFAGPSAIVFWTDDLGPKSRLTAATFTPGEAAASAPRVVIDEPLTRDPPMTARLPSGAWAVAWLTSSGGLSTLRVSPIGPGGMLTGPTDVAKLSRSALIDITSGERGLHFSWQEPDPSDASAGSTTSTAKIVHVTCAAAP